MATDYLTSGRNLRSLMNDGLGQFNEDVSEAQMCGKPPLCVSLSFTNRVQISRELTSRAHAARVSDNVQVPRFTAEGAGSSLFQVFFFFLFFKAYRVVCISHQSDCHIRVCISHQSGCRIRVCTSHQSYPSIWISCTNHSVWILFSCK